MTTLDDEATAMAVKSAATGVASVAVAFGLTWWAVAAALVGAAASLHFEPEQQGKTVAWSVVRILVLGLVGAALAAVTTHLPVIFGFSLAEVPIAVRAFLLGLFANPIYKRLRREADSRNAPGG